MKGLIRETDVAHLAADLLLTLQHIAAGIGRTETSGIRKRGSNEGALVGRELTGRGAEMLARDGLYTIDARACLNAVEIDLHDALLRPTELNEHSKVGLQTFAQP